MMFRGLFQDVNFLLHRESRAVISGNGTEPRWLNGKAPGFAVPLLLEQHLGDDNPEAEQTNESDCGDNGFHLLELP